MQESSRTHSFVTRLGIAIIALMSAMNKPSQQSVRIKQFKVWTVMAATFILGLLLAFGRWASDDPTLMGFTPVAWNAFPVGWILAIEYGLIVSMVAAVIRADRVDSLFSSAETLTWLGGIALFTAGLYHDNGIRSKFPWVIRSDVVWGGTVNGYGTITHVLSRASLDALPSLLSAWPMAYGLIAAATSFVTIMGWKRPFLLWRWILHALFLVAVTAAFIAVVIGNWNALKKPNWLDGSVVVLPILVVSLVVVRDPARKIQWMNLIAAAWLATALFPQLDLGGVVLPISEGLARMQHGFRILVLGDLLLLGGSLAALFVKDRI